MKIAYLFLCRTDIHHPSIWKKYFSLSSKDKYNIYIHPDADKKMVDDFFKNFEISEKQGKDATHTVESRIALLKEATKDKENKFFIFLSEDSVPIVTKTFNKSYIC